MKLGRSRKSRYDRRTPWLSRYLDARAYDAPPPHDDWTGPTSAYTYLGNDRVGNCTYAALGHMFQQRSALIGMSCRLTEGHVIDAYKAGTGYDGSPETDNGGQMIDALIRAKHVGIGPYKIEAFARVNVHDDVEMKAALHAFGCVYVGASLPRRIRSQGASWYLPPADQRTEDDVVDSLGGHAFLYTGQQRGSWIAMPWVEKTRIDDPWSDLQVDEGWVALCPLWSSAMRVAPNGFDYQRLLRDLSAIGA